MDPLFTPIDLIIHFDKYLPGIIQVYGVWTYLILFIIIFCETGLVFLPYLPGDSLIFIAGALAGAGFLNIEVLIFILITAAVLGDTVNYWIGHTTGIKVLGKRYSVVKAEHLKKTEEYFTRYGGKTIVIARFIPFIRTFAPFLAGVGKMNYRWFLMYNLIGGTLWVLVFALSGFFFGRIPVVQENFNLIVYAIIGLSLLAVGSIIVGVLRSAYSDAASDEDDSTGKE
jgi:membrane-associated protein